MKNENDYPDIDSLELNILIALDGIEKLKEYLTNINEH